MTVDDTVLEPRIQGSLLPDTRITITEDGEVVSPVATWNIEGAPLGQTARTWNKTTSITTDGDELVIGWETLDLGACTPGYWWLEATGVTGSKPRKLRMTIRIDPEVTA